MTGIEITLLLVGIVFMIGSFLVTEKLSGSELDKVSELSEDEIKKILARELEAAQKDIEDKIKRSIDDSIDEVDRALEKETNEKIMAISEYSDTVMENMNKTHNEITFLYSMLNDKHTAMTQYADELQELVTKLEEKRTEFGEMISEDMSKECLAEIERFQAAMEEKEAVVLKEMEDTLRTLQNAKAMAEKEKEEKTDTKDENSEQEQEIEEQELVEADSIEQEEVGEIEEEISEPDEIQEPEETNHNARILELHKAGYSDVQIAKELELGTGEVRLVLGLFREEEA